MPKMKGRKALRRRMRLTRTGKLMRTRCGVRHLLADRSPKRMRNAHKPGQTTAKGMIAKIRRATGAKVAKRTSSPPPPAASA